MRVDRASRQIAAPPDRAYQSLTDREAVQSWLPPADARRIYMSSNLEQAAHFA